MRNYFCWLFGIFILSSVTCWAQDDSVQPFSLDDLIENAEVSAEPPASRELPWYITAIQKPASRVVFTLCNAWDWVRTKSTRAINSLRQTNEPIQDDKQQKQSPAEKASDGES